MIFDVLEAKLVGADLAQIGSNFGVVSDKPNLFRMFMPSETTIGIMTRMPLSGIPVDPYMPNRYKGRMQIIVRHVDPVEGSVLAAAISKVLDVRSPENYPASSERGIAHITHFIPQTLPIQFPRLDGGGIEWSQHFDAVFSFDPL